MELNAVYKIALCDDENVISEEQEKICHDVLNKLNINHNISVFSNSEDFLKAFLTGIKYDLILLDILMDGMDGMELAQKIRETDSNAAIIFITSSRNYVFQGYDVNALHYLMKPLDGVTLGKLIVSDYKKRTTNDSFVFESSAGKYRAAIRDIIYLETRGRKVAVILNNGEILYAGKLSELLLMLPKDQFFRCHQSFAVNISNIRELTRYSAIATNGIKIPISRSFSKEMRKVFVRQLWKN